MMLIFWELSWNFWTWLDSQILLLFFLISEASVNLECISWKIGFCVAPTKDSDSILIYLLSTTGRGPCSYLMLKGNLRLPPIREMRRSINRVKRRIIFCFSLTWQENIQHRKRHNTHRNKPGTKALRLTFGIIWPHTQKKNSLSRYSSRIFCIFLHYLSTSYMSTSNHVVSFRTFKFPQILVVWTVSFD